MACSIDTELMGCDTYIYNTISVQAIMSIKNTLCSPHRLNVSSKVCMDVQLEMICDCLISVRGLHFCVLFSVNEYTVLPCLLFCWVFLKLLLLFV